MKQKQTAQESTARRKTDNKPNAKSNSDGDAEGSQGPGKTRVNQARREKRKKEGNRLTQEGQRRGPGSRGAGRHRAANGSQPGGPRRTGQQGDPGGGTTDKEGKGLSLTREEMVPVGKVSPHRATRRSKTSTKTTNYKPCTGSTAREDAGPKTPRQGGRRHQHVGTCRRRANRCCAQPGGRREGENGHRNKQGVAGVGGENRAGPNTG